MIDVVLSDMTVNGTVLVAVISKSNAVVVRARALLARGKLLKVHDQQLGGIEITLEQFFFTSINTQIAVFLVDLLAFCLALMPSSCVVKIKRC